MYRLLVCLQRGHATQGIDLTISLLHVHHLERIKLHITSWRWRGNTIFCVRVSKCDFNKSLLFLSKSYDSVRFIQSLCLFSFVPGNRYDCNCLFFFKKTCGRRFLTSLNFSQSQMFFSLNISFSQLQKCQAWCLYVFLNTYDKVTGFLGERLPECYSISPLCYLLLKYSIECH